MIKYIKAVKLEIRSILLYRKCSGIQVRFCHGLPDLQTQNWETPCSDGAVQDRQQGKVRL